MESIDEESEEEEEDCEMVDVAGSTTEAGGPSRPTPSVPHNNNNNNNNNPNNDSNDDDGASPPNPTVRAALPSLSTNHIAGRYRAIECLLCQYNSSENIFRSKEKISNKGQVQVDTYYKSMVTHSNIAKLASLLHELSTHVADKAGLYSLDQLALKQQLRDEGQGTGEESDMTEQSRLEAMLLVARRGQEYAAGNTNSEAIVKLKLMLSYLMLHLTLEHGVVPNMRASEGILATRNSIEGRKLAVFQRLLEEQGRNLKLGTLKDNVRFGKVLWNIVSTIGVLGLPMLAICGPAVTTLCRDNGLTTRHFEILGSRLTSNATWMCLCQAWAPIAIEVIFTNSARAYTGNDLFRLLFSQPLPQPSIYRLSHHYLMANKVTPPVRGIATRSVRATLNHRAAAEALDDMGITLRLFPQDNYRNRATKRVELVSWLLEQDGEEELVMGRDDAKPVPKRATTIALKEFATLLPPERISNDLVGFLGALWNARALPGWAMISPVDAPGLLLGNHGGDPVLAITILLGGGRFNVAYEDIIVPVMVNGITLPLHVSLKERCATLYQTFDTRAPTAASEEKMRVSHLLDSYIYLSGKWLI